VDVFNLFWQCGHIFASLDIIIQQYLHCVVVLLLCGFSGVDSSGDILFPFFLQKGQEVLIAL
jgi:hypothetical protein